MISPERPALALAGDVADLPAPPPPPSCLVCGAAGAVLVDTVPVRPAGEKDYGIPAERYRRAIYQCRSCGVYLNAHGLLPDGYYEGAYNEATYRGDLLAPFERIRALPPEASDNKQRVGRIVAHLRGRGLALADATVLDVGSGLCVFLAELKAHGPRCWCIDPDPSAAEHARRHAGVDHAYAGTLDTFETDVRFDLVTFNKVLEHVTDPARLLQQAARLLAPGGAIYVELPDGDLARRHGRPRDRQEFFTEHHAIYNPSALARLAKAAGLRCEGVTSIEEPSGKCTVYGFLTPVPVRAGFRAGFHLPLRGRTAGDAAAFLGGNVLYQAARFVVYLVAAKVLGPSLYGLWNGLLLVLTYGVNYAHFGVLNAMNREIPYNRGRGEEGLNRRIVDTSFTTAVIVAAALGALSLLASVLPRWEASTALGLRVLAVLLVLEQLQVFYDTVLRSHAQFRRVAVEQVLLAVLLLTVGIGLTVWAGFAGFLAGQVVAYGLVLVYLVRSAPVRPRLRFDWPTTRALARIGFPIMAVGFAYGMLTSLDRVMVLGALGREQLGYYSLAFMAYGTLMLIPRSVSQMVYPRMAWTYGQTGDPAALRDLIYRPLRYLLVVMVPLLVAVYFVGPLLIEALLPQYVPGIPAFRITVIGIFFLAFMSGFGNFLNTVNRQKLYLAIQVAALGLNAALNAYALAAGYGITGVAVATLVTQVAYVGALALAAHRVLAHAGAAP